MVNNDRINVDIAKQEYDDREIGYKLRLEKGDYVGTLSDINNNRSNNEEQIYTYTKTEPGENVVLPNDPLS